MLTAQLFDTKDFRVCSKVARKGAQNVKAKSQGNDVGAFATCLSVGTLPDSDRCFLFFFALMSTVHYRIEGSGAMYLSRSEEWARPRTSICYVRSTQNKEGLFECRPKMVRQFVEN